MTNENREIYDWEQDKTRGWFNNQCELAFGIKPPREGSTA